MTHSPRLPLIVFAIGLLGMGVLALVVGDFALQWQPVEPWVPGRTFLAYAAGLLMLACGAALLASRTQVWAARVVFPYLVLWMLLKIPALFAAPGVEGVWLGFGEIVMLACGGWVLFASYGCAPEASPLAALAGDRGLYRARIAFGLALLPVGLSHLVYTDATIGFVPAWLPFRGGFALLTGFGQIACGLGLLFNVLPRVAAFCEAAMVSLFTLLVWGPKLITAPGVRLNWTAFWISWIIGGAAWMVAYATPASPRISISDPQPHSKHATVVSS